MRCQLSQFWKPGLGEVHRLAAEILPALELVGLLGRRRHHRLHRIGVPGVHDLRLGRLVVLERADALLELGHADVGRVGDLALAIHHRLHGDRRRLVGLHRDGVFAAERLLDDLRHRGGDRVAVGAHLRRGPAQRLALLRRRRVRHGGREHRGHGHGRHGQKAVSSRHGHQILSLCLVSAAGSAPACSSVVFVAPMLLEPAWGDPVNAPGPSSFVASGPRFRSSAIRASCIAPSASVIDSGPDGLRLSTGRDDQQGGAPMDLELKGKAAIVTGGNRGIGKAIALGAGARRAPTSPSSRATRRRWSRPRPRSRASATASRCCSSAPTPATTRR